MNIEELAGKMFELRYHVEERVICLLQGEAETEAQYDTGVKAELASSFGFDRTLQIKLLGKLGEFLKQHNESVGVNAWLSYIFGNYEKEIVRFLIL